jgi:bacillithiol biosynthesis cysteine-adding enzyme BshC
VIFELADIDILSSATKAFVRKDERLLNFFGPSHPYFSISKAIEGKKDFSIEKRSILVTQLKKQYQDILGSNEADILVKKQIELLAEPNTFTVTTGQQLHLFLGPALVLYKIIATIKAVQQFKEQFPENNFVPVYWLASEDHDFEEIKGTKVFQHQFDLPSNQGGATGRYHVREVGGIIEDIRRNISLNDENIALLNDLENIYTHAKTLSEASIRVAHYLLGKYGLICIDGDNKALKSLFVPQIKNDILNRDNIRHFDSCSAELENMGLSLQLKGRDINIFYLSKNNRSRIIEENGQYKILETEIIFTREQLIADIEANPESYSPNAVLRPLYQETILPNICYIGGNAEVNYWLQLKDVFTSNSISPPLLVLRPSLWIIPSKALKWLEKQAIESITLFQTSNLKELVRLLDDSGDVFKQKIEEFLSLKQALQDAAAQEKTSFLKELAEQGKVYEKILKKIDNEANENRVIKMEADFKKLENIKSTYYDLHHIQERKTSCVEMLIKYEDFISEVYNSLEFKPSSGQILSL